MTILNEQWNAPFRFVERPQEVQAIEERLISGIDRVVILEGSAGTGKTALARSFAEKNQSAFPGGIRFQGGLHLFAGSSELLAQIPVGPLASLLVFDGIDEVRPPRNWIPEFFALSLARDPQLKILATSRPHIEGMPFERVHLHNFNSNEAIELIQKLAEASGRPPAELIDLAAGNALTLATLGQLIRQQGGDYEAILKMLGPFTRHGLVGPDGRPLNSRTGPRQRIIADIRDTNDELLWFLKRDPDLVFTLSPRKFEEVTAELFAKLGYEVTLTPASKDGGKDLFIARRDDLGSFVFYVECKRYAPNRPVGVALINALTGVVERGRATAGLMLTTSRFTSGARAIQSQMSHRLTLKDYGDFKAMLDKISPGE